MISFKCKFLIESYMFNDNMFFFIIKTLSSEVFSSFLHNSNSPFVWSFKHFMEHSFQVPVTIVAEDEFSKEDIYKGS